MKGLHKPFSFIVKTKTFSARARARTYVRKNFFNFFNFSIDNQFKPCYNIDILKERRKQCFTNTSSEDAFATSPQRLSKFSKRNAERSKMSAERGKICAEHTKSLARVMTQWIGQSTLTSTKIATEYALAIE